MSAASHAAAEATAAELTVSGLGARSGPLLTGQQVDSSARRQLTRLHGLTGRLVSADPSSSLSLILSALGAALGSERLCIHLVTPDSALVCAASLGLAPQLLGAWSRLSPGPAGGPVGLAAAAECPVIEENVQAGTAWGSFAELARSSKVASSWSVPVLGPGGLLGVITVFRATVGKPRRDDLDLATLYAGYAAGAVERDRLLNQVTSRNRVLETIREMLQTLAGPLPVADGLVPALQALRRGLESDEVVLAVREPDGPSNVRAAASSSESGSGSPAALRAATGVLADGPDGVPVASTGGSPPLVADAGRGMARSTRATAQGRTVPQYLLSVAFPAPGGRTALVARWRGAPPPTDSAALLEDAAHSLQLALEREAAWFAIQEATALRRSREMQRGFLSRLSHELRTPLTAIKGYASSLLQPDVTWDAGTQHRFLTTIAAESSRLSRLVDDLLRFSAIEAGIMQLQPDWCDIPLVLEAAVACLPPTSALRVDVQCAPDLPAVWADHDRLEQVFVNLLANATGHNPASTRVQVTAERESSDSVLVTVADDGLGMPPDVAATPFEPMRRRHRSPGSGSGLGLSIVRGIVVAHGGLIELEQPPRGTRFRIQLPVENTALSAATHALEAVADG